MKRCEGCGFENPDDAVVCEQCQKPLTATVTGEEGKQAEAPSAHGKNKQREIRMPKINISDETKAQVKNIFGEALQYIGDTILHPGKTSYEIQGGALGCIGIIMGLISMLWLYIVQRGLQMAIFSTVASRIHMSWLYTLLFGLALTLMLLVVSFIIALLAQFVQKSKKSVKTAAVEAVHTCIIPMTLLLISTIIAAFWFTAGIFCFCVVFVAYIMNIVLLFGSHQNYLSYVAVTIALSLVLFATALMVAQLIRQWTLDGYPLNSVSGSLLEFLGMMIKRMP